jgi:DNA-binding SARP family transcriptional activator
VAVAFADASPDVLRCVVESAVPDRSGVAVVAAGPLPDARWRLEVDASGTARLCARAGDKPFSMDLRVDPDTEVMSLLAADLAWAARPADEPRVVGLDGGEAEQPGPVGQGAVEIGVIGPLEISGGPGADAVESKRRRPAMAVLGYMATHRQPVTSQELARALWPSDPAKPNLGGGAPSTVNNVVSHAKSLLGRNANGEELLVYTPDGYRFAEGVVSHWAEFQRLAAEADSQDGPARIDSWRRALQLVRGVPFGNAAGKYLEWVASERLDDKIKSGVVDVASSLAGAALELEDWDTVRWAVDKGLSVDPVREELFQLLMHAEGRAGRPARVHEIYGQLCSMLQKHVDFLQTPSDKSEEIWKSYTAQGAAKR